MPTSFKIMLGAMILVAIAYAGIGVAMIMGEGPYSILSSQQRMLDEKLKSDLAKLKEDMQCQ